MTVITVLLYAISNIWLSCTTIVSIGSRVPVVVLILVYFAIVLSDSSSRHQTSVIYPQLSELSFSARAKGGRTPLDNHRLAGTVHTCVHIPV